MVLMEPNDVRCGGLNVPKRSNERWSSDLGHPNAGIGCYLETDVRCGKA
jgi:hypothetical protein